jgi:hypothetical protein
MIKIIKEFLKRRVAGSELDELYRWRVQFYEHRRWFAEFQDVSDVLDSIKAKVSGDVYSDDIPSLRNILRDRLITKNRTFTEEQFVIMAVIESLNEDLYSDDNTSPQLRFVMDGWVYLVEFMGETIWDSENDDHFEEYVDVSKIFRDIFIERIEQKCEMLNNTLIKIKGE